MIKRLGRYELLAEIGSGGMAVVHLGRVVGEGGFERLIAVKVLNELLARDREFVAMFLDEARLAALVRHPNVVPTTDVQLSDEAIYLVMEYVEGPSLSQLLKQLRTTDQRVPLDIAVRIMLDVLSGLEAAHELTDRDGRALQLVHRDVTPHNVMIGKDGVARLTDFGVARAEARLSSTQSGQLKGKFPYMSPEQIASEAVDRRTDIYAAGLVMWDLLVGRRRFLADNHGALVHQILAGVGDPPSTRCPQVPAAIDEVCMRALALSPDGRFASAAEFAEELEEAARASIGRIANARKVAAFVEPFVPRVSGLPPQPDTVSALRTPASTEPESTTTVRELDGDDTVLDSHSASIRTATAFVGAEPSSRRGLVAGGALAALAVSGVAAMLLLAEEPVNEAPTGQSAPATAAALLPSGRAELSAPVAMSGTSASPPTVTASTTAAASAAPSSPSSTRATAADPSRSSAPPSGRQPPGAATKTSAPSQPTAAPQGSSAADYLPPAL